MGYGADRGRIVVIGPVNRGQRRRSIVILNRAAAFAIGNGCAGRGGEFYKERLVRFDRDILTNIDRNGLGGLIRQEGQ